MTEFDLQGESLEFLPERLELNDWSFNFTNTAFVHQSNQSYQNVGGVAEGNGNANVGDGTYQESNQTNTATVIQIRFRNFNWNP